MFGDLSVDQLTWIVEHPDEASERKVKAANILLDAMMMV
jgi:hypothetical protein